MNFTLRQRFYFFGLLMVLLIISFGTFSYKNSETLMKYLSEVSKNKLPALKNQTLADMMHDGMRGVVMEALYQNEIKNADRVNELKIELEEKSNDFKKYIAELESLTLSDNTKLLIEKVKPSLEGYIKSSKSLLAEMDNAKSKEELKVEFKKTFEDVEEQMEKMGAAIEKEAFESSDSGERNLQLIFWSLLAISLIAIIVSLVLSTSTNKLFTRVSAKLNDAVKSSEEVCQQSHLSAQNIAAASVEQNQAVATCSKLSHKTKELIEETSTQIQGALKKTKVIVTSGQAGLLKIDELIECMNGMQKILEDFEELIGTIKTIDTKTSIINDIVFKTQLLSFNASIEAARAGEHGRGFSVVAEEISKLALTSGNAANSIQQLLKESNEKVSSMGGSVVKKIDDSRNITSHVSDQIKEMFNKVVDVENDFSELSLKCDEETESILQSNAAIEQIDSASKNNSQSAQTSLKNIHRLIDTNDKIKEATGSISLLLNGHKNNTKVA
ncbi:MAG: methyl-accepting chemotaxis protein [Bacteriovoracaceae bacterium]|nr:methyl-accepting chemotaxis protein [Bacteriovoracaceae bacterium]